MAVEKVCHSPFVARKRVEWPGQKDFDEYYEEISILDRVKKTGEGENDFIVEKFVQVDKKPIAEVVAVDAESVGVYNIMKQVLRTGDTSLLPIDKGTGEIVDLVDAPDTLMDLDNMGKEAAKKFAGLPGELTNDMDMTAFVNSMTQEKFDAFIKAVADRQAAAAGKVEKENE